MTFLVTFVCGTAIAYSFMLLLTSLSVWMVRNQSLMEMWWLFSSLARYPKEIFAGRLAEPLGVFFTFFVPILVVVNVPANAMVRVLDPAMVAFVMVALALALAQPPVLPARGLRSYRKRGWIDLDHRTRSRAPRSADDSSTIGPD